MVNANILIGKIELKSLWLRLKTFGSGREIILVSTEPEAAYPPNFGWISKVICRHRFYPGRLASISVRYPIDMSRPHAIGDRDRARQACFVASNRFSPLPDSNYTLRAQIAASAEVNLVSVRGNYWGLGHLEKLVVVLKHVIVSLVSGSSVSISKCINYVSQASLSHKPIQDKFSFMTKFTVAIVIENESTYVSEKLIESIQAGCIPVYVGPNVPENWIPKDLYIKAKPDIASIYCAVKVALDADLLDMQLRQSEWLSGGSARLWSREQVQREIENQIGEGEVFDYR